MFSYRPVDVTSHLFVSIIVFTLAQVLCMFYVFRITAYPAFIINFVINFMIIIAYF
jgi:hypothetical protein